MPRQPDHRLPDDRLPAAEPAARIATRHTSWLHARHAELRHMGGRLGHALWRALAAGLHARSGLPVPHTGAPVQGVGGVHGAARRAPRTG